MQRDTPNDRYSANITHNTQYFSGIQEQQQQQQKNSRQISYFVDSKNTTTQFYGVEWEKRDID